MKPCGRQMGRGSGASSFPGKEDAFSLRGSPRQAARINIFFFLFLSIGIGVVCGLNALVVSRSFLGCFPSRRMSPSPMACPVCGCAPDSKMIISYLFSKVNLFSAVCTTIAGANHLQICNRPVRHSRRLHERRRGRQPGDPSGFAAGGRLRAAPTRCGGNRGLAETQSNEILPPT